MKVNRLWDYISIHPNWLHADTSIVDDIAPSWFSRREKLLINSREYEDFINQLKRRHAIETGIVERMYDLDKGVTETLIKEGFLASLISHGDTNIEKSKLLNHLQDHLEAVDFIFDIVKENRPLTKGFICELHQLTTRHQTFAEGRDQFGNKTKIALIKGRFKIRENNPTREDGTLIMYCSPDHVEAEMDRLILLYQEMTDKNVHPLIIASWVHHAFTTIHPFQDGNGRVVRLVASLILIKYNYFPITVLREEAKIKYIEALELADIGQPQKLVSYFGEIQKRNIEAALNIKEVTTSTLTDVTAILKQKIQKSQNKPKSLQFQQEQTLSKRRLQVYECCNTFLQDYKNRLNQEFGDTLEVLMDSAKPDNISKQQYYDTQIVAYAAQHRYFFNRFLPKSYFTFTINVAVHKKYDLGITIHHYGYDDTTLAIGAFLEYKADNMQKSTNNMIDLDVRPHILSVEDELNGKAKNINLHLENILTMVIAQIASEIV